MPFISSGGDYRKHGANIIMFRLGGWIDILGAFIAAPSDPFTIPPMILLFLIAGLGNGIQHGLYFFVESMIGSLYPRWRRSGYSLPSSR